MSIRNDLENRISSLEQAIARDRRAIENAEQNIKKFTQFAASGKASQAQVADFTARQQANIQAEEARIARTQASIDQIRAEIDQLPPVVPTPPKTAGATVADDAVPNPIKQQPLETDADTGRLQPSTATGTPSNADRVPTTATGDADTNTNGPTKTFSATQGTSTSQDDGQGGAPIPNPLPPTVVNPTDPGQGGEGGGGSAGPDAVPPSGTPKTAAGVAAVDDKTSPSSGARAVEVNNAYNADQTVQPRDNILDRFASYTYGISVYLMTPEAYKNFVTTKVRTLNGSNLLFQSGGAPASNTIKSPSEVTSTPNTTAGRNPYFDVDFYIDSLSIDTSFPGKQTQAAHMASELKFTVIEPNGITLLDRIYAAVQDHVPKDGAGKVNYTAVQYLLAIRWYGWDRFGNLIRNVGETNGLTDPNAAVEKFFPFKIQKINWSVNNKLVTYDFVCAPVGQMVAGGQARGTIPYDIELTDNTVGGLLGGDAVYNTESVNTAPNTNPAAPPKANAAPSSKTTIRQGLMGAMNDFQQKLVQDKKYEYADRYEIVFANGAESIRDASITKPTNTIKNLGKSPMGKPATQDPNALDPRKSQVDNTLRNSAVTAGQQLLQVIDLTIRNSTYITQQARTVDQEVMTDELGIPLENPTGAPATAKVSWFNITMESIPRTNEYDYKRNDYAYDIRYIISPYTVTNFDSKYFPIPKFNGLHKSYKYWFTGQNTAVLDYQATFNSLYNMTVTGSEPGNNATEAIRRQYTSSMREIPMYSYQSSSSESRTGADGKGNEISSNAAQYLYSPSDLATTKLRIVGDPGWIQQGSLAAGVDPKNFQYQGFLPDGTINFDSSQVLFEIAWQRPEDYDLGTGLADPYSQFGGTDRQPLQSFVYQARKCTSEFRQGKFEQTIEGSLYNFPITEQRNTSASQPASVSVGTDGKSDRASDAVSPAALVLPGGGALAAPSVIDTVQRSASNIAQATGVDPGTILGAQNRPASGDGVQSVDLPAPTAQNRPAQPTNQPSQQISVET
jgi:hypothetical protein